MSDARDRIAAEEQERWHKQTVAPALARFPGTEGRVHHRLRRSRAAAVHASRRFDRLPARPRVPRRVPLHPRRPADHVPRPVLDHAPVRRLRHRRGVQRSATATCWSRARPASPSPSTCRPRWATTPTTRSPRARWARSAWPSTRSADMETLVRRHPARQGHHLDDDQRHGGDPAGAVHRRGREAGRDAGASSRGTIQNDILKEYIARGTYIYPPQPSHAHRSPTSSPTAPRTCPQWNTISHQRLPHPRGRLDRRAGGGLHAGRRHRLRARPRIEAGLDVDDFAPRLSFFFNAHNDFFEEVAKFRAARRMWAQHHARALRRQEPALAGCCASTPRPPARRSPRSSRTTTSCAWPCRRWRRCWAAPSRCTPTRMDEALALPTEEAVRIALRTQQIIAYEVGRGRHRSTRWPARYYVECLTDEIERRAMATTSQRIDEMGGARRAPSSSGFMQRRDPGRPPTSYQRAGGERRADHRRREPLPGRRAAARSNLLTVDPAVQEAQQRKLRGGEGPAGPGARTGRRRPGGRRRGTDNLMPPILAAVKAYATLQRDLRRAARASSGEYQPTEERLLRHAKDSYSRCQARPGRPRPGREGRWPGPSGMPGSR